MIDNLDKVVETLEILGQPGDAESMEAFSIKLNVKAWKEESKALDRFAPAIAMALAFDQHVSLLVNLAADTSYGPAAKSRPQSSQRF